jgi:capsular exopolysaccharide synthesis family protein
MSVEQQNDPLLKMGYEEEEAGIPFRHYWITIRKHLWTILLVFCLVISLSALYLINQSPIYRAQVTLEIRTEAPQVLGGEVEPVIDPAAGARYWSTDEYYETQYRIIRSRAVAEEVVDLLGLESNLEFLGLSEGLEPDLLAQELEVIDPIALVNEMTRVEPVLDSHLVLIAVEYQDPEFATLLANTIADVYVSRNARRQLRGTDEAFYWLEAERTELRQRVSDSEQILLGFRQEHAINSESLSSRQEQLTEHLTSINHLLDEVRSEISAVRAEQLRVQETRRIDNIDEVPITAVIENPLVQDLKQQREQLLNESVRLRSRYGELHHEVVGITQAIELVETAIHREINSILDSYDTNLELERVEAMEGVLQREKELILSEMTQLSLIEPQYNQLRRDIDNDTSVLAMIERRYKETDLYRRQQDVNNIEVLDAAIVPISPIRPQKRTTMMLAIILGFGFSLLVAFVLEAMDNTVRTQEDIERFLGFTFLGVVPSIKNSRNNKKGKKSELHGPTDLYVHDNPKSSVAECCRAIRTNLHFMSPDRKIRRILVTSAGPREGKTSTAINMATVMAQSNYSVLLVDTDMRRPRIHKALGLRGNVGMTNLILGEMEVSDAIQHTVVPNLDVLACGPIPPNPTELMHTERFKEVVRSLSEKYDRVIFDSPPVIAVADAMILGNAVDGVLFVIKSCQTQKEVAKKAKNLLHGINAPLLGAILNDLDLENRTYRYHYYYSYYAQYGGYYEEENSPENQDSKENRVAKQRL